MNLALLKYLNSKAKSSEDNTVKLLETTETRSFLLDRKIDFEIIGPTVIESNSYLLVDRADLLKIA